MLGLPSALFFVWAVASREAARERKAEEEERRLDALIAAVDEHAATLRRKRRQLTRVDDYGVVFTEAWDREVGHFLKHVIAPVAGPNGMSFEETELVLEAIDEVSEEGSEGTGTVLDVGAMSPIEYEHYCAELLREAGWDARVTSATGDQGVDVVATRDGQTVAVQVKRYSGSVGNAAVQEAIAGKAFVGADLAVVVSPAPFTRSAIELANVAGVRLMHHEQLAEL